MANAEYVEPAGGLLRSVMDAHGGFATWHQARAVHAVMSTGGAIFAMRTTRTMFRQTEVIADLRRPHVELREFPKRGQRSQFEPGHVRIEDQSGNLLAERRDPRGSFGGIGKQLHWDHLNAVYFSEYAVWNYLTAPYLLCRSDVETEEGATCERDGATLRGLRATFPEGLPTHNREQCFYFDDQGHLRRHDYTAEVVGPYAVAAHYCDGHRPFSRAIFPTRRRVVPRTSSGRTLPFPTLVWIRVHEAELAA